MKKVVGLTMELGEVSTVVPDYFRDCFSWAIKSSTYMKECKLDLIILQAKSYCRDCKETFETVKHGKKCPHCGSENTYLVTGDEINIRDIAVVDEDAK